MPVSVFRRYTPPTCTLELKGTRSPLSIWSDRPVVKDIQFSLSIDGPHRHTDQKVTVRGDRFQLEDLHQVVSSYVQQTLALPIEQFQSTLLEFTSASTRHPVGNGAPTAQASHTSGIAKALNQTVSLPTAQWQNATPENGSHHRPQHHPTKPLSDRQLGNTVALNPAGALNHQLFLGPLATDNALSTILLTTTELFDLANALDQYHGEVDSLPELNPGQHRRTPAPWLKVAAVAVLAIGVGTSLVKLSQSPEPEEVALQSEADSAAVQADDPDIDGSPTRLRLPDIPAATEALPEEDADNRRRNPGNSGRANGNQSENQQNQNQNRQNQNRQNQEEEAIALRDPNNGTAAPANQTPPNANPNSPAAAAANPTPGSPAAPAPAPVPLGAGPPGTITNPQNTTPPTNQPISPTDIPPELSALPPIPTEMGDDILLDSSEINLSAPPPSSTGSSASRSASSSTDGDIASGSSSSTPSGWASGSGAYPQLTEVQAYFLDQWTPPPNLKQPLQYRLRLNADGSLQQVIPLGESARTSTSVVGFPAIGEPFVSPFTGNNAPPIRLFLDSDGQVRVFLESLD